MSCFSMQFRPCIWLDNHGIYWFNLCPSFCIVSRCSWCKGCCVFCLCWIGRNYVVNPSWRTSDFSMWSLGWFCWFSRRLFLHVRGVLIVECVRLDWCRGGVVFSLVHRWLMFEDFLWWIVMFCRLWKEGKLVCQRYCGDNLRIWYLVIWMNW